jgi:hypothetical protein
MIRIVAKFRIRPDRSEPWLPPPHRRPHRQLKKGRERNAEVTQQRPINEVSPIPGVEHPR